MNAPPTRPRWQSSLAWYVGTTAVAVLIMFLAVGSIQDEIACRASQPVVRTTAPDPLILLTRPLYMSSTIGVPPLPITSTEGICQ